MAEQAEAVPLQQEGVDLAVKVTAQSAVHTRPVGVEGAGCVYISSDLWECKGPGARWEAERGFG